MTISAFISYAHKDEKYKDDLLEHMAGLRRSGIIKEWHDRKIVPGQDWETEISENLESSELILFLISSSFMNSDYCMGKEVQTALEMHRAGKAQLIPIIIRPVDWADTELSMLQGLPKDAQPIATWDNIDSAWVNTIAGIKKLISSFKPNTDTQVKKSSEKSVASEQFQHWLDDTEIVLTHRRVNQVSLSDIYVIPDIEMESADDLLVEIKSASNLIKVPTHYIIAGEEQQGKTSLLKYLHKESLKNGLLPVYIEAASIKKANPEDVISPLLKQQYQGLDFDAFKDSGKAVLLIDNLDEISLNQKYRDNFLEGVSTLTDEIYITCHNSFQLVYGEVSALDQYERVELLGLGNKKREELTQKWISLGNEESIQENELYSQCDELKSRLNIVIKKNIVPPKPIYILMLLQMFEANAQLNLDLTSYGHCYQQLIYQSFDKAKIEKKDFDKYLNVLTEFAWDIFINEREPNVHQVSEFFRHYSKTFLAVDKDIILTKLVGHSILSSDGIKTGFKYPYIYYFFVGKKIAESFQDSEETKDQVKLLLEKLHREDFANILIFITHHTKDSWVLDNIKTVLKGLFEEHDSASLDKDKLSFMSEFMSSIPDLIIEQREIQSERDKHNEHLDRFERAPVDDDDDQPVDILASINKTFKGMEVAGQIIRNRHATLTRAALKDLAKTGVNSGLRFLEYFINISDAAQNEIIKMISSHLSKHPDLSDKEIEKQAESAYLHITYGVINGVTRKIASSIGSKEALEVYRELERNINTPALYLVRQAIELQFNKSINIDHLSNCASKLQGNQVCLRILREMVIQHIYLFPVDFKEKQQLSSLLGIPIKNQRLMDIKKRGKG